MINDNEVRVKNILNLSNGHKNNDLNTFLNCIKTSERVKHPPQNPSRLPPLSYCISFILQKLYKNTIYIYYIVHTSYSIYR